MSRTYKGELCMKFDTCKRCPKNKLCEAELLKQEEKRNEAKAKGENKNNIIKNRGD